MRRVPIPERPDWRLHAARAGFTFHTFDGAPYWDESAYYAFSLAEIEDAIEAPSAALHDLCLAFVDRAVRDAAILRSLRIPEHAWDAIRASWARRDPSLYGRFDFSYGGDGPAKLLEYNADTPTALYESAVFQWLWLEDGLARGRLPAGADQFNTLHEALVARLAAVAPPEGVAFAGFPDAPEDRGTLAYLQDCALQAGRPAPFLPVEAIGLAEDGRFVDAAGIPIGCLFKLYPWEWMFADPFGRAVGAAATRFLEPPWKAVLSNKGLLAHLWAMAPGHPNLLLAYEGKGIILAITQGAEPPDWPVIEDQAHALLNAGAAVYADGTPMNLRVSIGNPIPPYTNRNQRVKKTFDRATDRAMMRSRSNAAQRSKMSGKSPAGVF